MTDKQRNTLNDLMRLAATVLLAVTGFFLVRSIDQLDEVTKQLHNLHIEIVQVRRDIKQIEEIKTDVRKIEYWIHHQNNFVVDEN